MTVDKLIKILQEMPPEAIVGFFDGDEYFAVKESLIKLKYKSKNVSVDNDTLVDVPKKNYIPVVIL